MTVLFAICINAKEKQKEILATYILNVTYIYKIMFLTFSDEEVEHGECDGVPAEHVVAAGTYSLDGHPCATPNEISLRNFKHQMFEFRALYGIVTRLAL